jgi:hypothetical protein
MDPVAARQLLREFDKSLVEEGAYSLKGDLQEEGIGTLEVTVSSPPHRYVLQYGVVVLPPELLVHSPSNGFYRLLFRKAEPSDCPLHILGLLIGPRPIDAANVVFYFDKDEKNLRRRCKPCDTAIIGHLISCDPLGTVREAYPKKVGLSPWMSPALIRVDDEAGN